MLIMVDINFNYVGPVGQDFYKITPFNGADHYHPYCLINYMDWDNQWRVEVAPI